MGPTYVFLTLVHRIPFDCNFLMISRASLFLVWFSPAGGVGFKRVFPRFTCTPQARSLFKIIWVLSIGMQTMGGGAGFGVQWDWGAGAGRVVFVGDSWKLLNSSITLGTRRVSFFLFAAGACGDGRLERFLRCGWSVRIVLWGQLDLVGRFAGLSSVPCFSCSWSFTSFTTFSLAVVDLVALWLSLSLSYQRGFSSSASKSRVQLRESFLFFTASMS